jgi:HEAT repeat protein
VNGPHFAEKESNSMNKESQPSPGSPSGSRRIIVGIVVGLGLLAVALVVLHKPASPTQASPGTTSVTPVAPPTTADTASGTSTGTPTTAQNASALQAGVGASTNAGGQDGSGPQLSVAEAIKTLKDASRSIEDRKQAIKALAQNGTAEAIAALKDALASGSAELRAAIAQGLGDCASPECTSMLLGLLNDPSADIVKAAIKGLAQQNSAGAVDALTKLMYDPMRSVDVQIASISGLGTMDQAGAFQALSQAATTVTDEDTVKAILDAIGGRNFDETQTFFQNYLRNPSVSSELRVAAVEALSTAQGDPTAFLASLASDPDSDVRTSAAWAMSATEATGNIGTQLLGMVQAENDPDVRLRLYQALENQESLDPSAVLAAARNEKDPAAFVKALDLVSKTLRDSPTPDLQTYFTQTAVPALQKIALTADSTDERMGAVIALVRANDTSVMPAMQQIAQQATDPKVARAANNFVNSFAASNGNGNSAPQPGAPASGASGK